MPRPEAVVGSMVNSHKSRDAFATALDRGGPASVYEQAWRDKEALKRRIAGVVL